MRLSSQLQEIRELGIGGTVFRAWWELKTRTIEPFVRICDEPGELVATANRSDWISRLPFADPLTVADAMRSRVGEPALRRLRDTAEAAAGGELLCFGRWVGAYGQPIDWHFNPTTGKRWDARLPWAKALHQDATELGDVKIPWEAGRFPQAYHLARAAAFFPDSQAAFADILTQHLAAFESANPIGRGIHWASGQEVALRTLTWIFATDTLLSGSTNAEKARAIVGSHILAGARQIDRTIEYARHAVYNNHLLSEALGLYVAGLLMPDAPEASRWRREGRETLETQAGRQFYPDGGYIQLSHNYQRMAIQLLVWAVVLARSAGERPAEPWLRAIERSLDFLFQHQTETTGQLPNFGANDGSNPMILTTCDFSDFRPTLQTASLLTRGERLYPPGPWDESPAWFLGPNVLDAPLRPPPRSSVSFAHTGFHVLRAADPRNFATFRCGSVLDRFSQMDMLHVDVSWRDLNIAVDGGSYLYNGPVEWHDYFLRTASHNTVIVDGADQMLHFRKFKTLYPTRARLLAFEKGANGGSAAGEHYGFERTSKGCVHRRRVIVEGDIVIVIDRVVGEGSHSVRLHWLLGAFPFTQPGGDARVFLDTPEGRYTVSVFGADGVLEKATVVAGEDDPPRGWVARYYGEKCPAPSLCVEHEARLPLSWFTVFAPGAPEVIRTATGFTAASATSSVTFALDAAGTA